MPLGHRVASHDAQEQVSFFCVASIPIKSDVKSYFPVSSEIETAVLLNFDHFEHGIRGPSWICVTWGFCH